jgi:hypothetical protein
MQAEALQVIDEIVARRDRGEEVIDPGGPIRARLIISVAHSVSDGPSSVHSLKT